MGRSSFARAFYESMSQNLWCLIHFHTRALNKFTYFYWNTCLCNFHRLYIFDTYDINYKTNQELSWNLENVTRNVTSKGLMFALICTRYHFNFVGKWKRAVIMKGALIILQKLQFSVNVIYEYILGNSVTDWYKNILIRNDKGVS